MVNKYLDRLALLIDEYRAVDLVQFETDSGKKADFDDLVWYHLDPNTGRRTKFLCGHQGRGWRGNAGVLAAAALPYPYNHLVKVWIIETASVPISAVEKQARISVVRKLFSVIDGDLYAQTEITIANLMLGKSYSNRLRPFINFCYMHGLMRKIYIKSSDDRDRTGHTSLDNNLEKLPKIAAVVALGSIFSSVFEPVGMDGRLSSGEEIQINDAMVVTFSLLSLASPNRAGAEISVLPKQRLNSYSENNGKPVYYLNWVGSKGYCDNNNHLLASLSEPIAKAINFFHDACEPARILCRFYENQNQSLKDLLGGLKIDPRINLNLDLDQKPNLFTLGYALGFYGVNDNVPVLKDAGDISVVYHNQRSRFFENKPIYSLRSMDKLSVSRSIDAATSSLPFLFGYTMLPEVFNGKLTVTVGEVQDWWVSYYKQTILPEFPFSFSTGESSIRLKDAMFCFLGNWFYGAQELKGSGGKIFQKSAYAVVPLRSLGTFASRRLAGISLGGESLFEKYGFSSELKILPHSLRHLSNTLADLSNIPVEIITAWSGRKDAQQTHTYIHTSHGDKASRVSAIMNPSEIDRKDIRVITQEELGSITNMPASVTSTGICTQNINVTPCNYLNDFVSQCFMCPETCHVAGDDKAINLLEKDFSFQASRLASVKCDLRLPTSQAMKDWFVLHSRHTNILSQLINLMKENLPGTIIRFSNKKSEFHLTDLDTKVIKAHACVLPDFEGALKRHIEDVTINGARPSNAPLRSLLSSFGLSEGSL